MTRLLARISPWWIAALLLAADVANAQNIYKCMNAGVVEYTDVPCARGHGEVIHRADDSEIIDKYLHLGQDVLARRYADSHGVDALYEERVATYRQQMKDDEVRRQQDETIAAEQRSEKARQQALANEADNRARLQAENDKLRQQNDEYRDQLAQPVNDDPLIYWSAISPPYLDQHHHHDRRDAHRPPPSKAPVFHPCTQLPGGGVQC